MVLGQPRKLDQDRVVALIEIQGSSYKLEPALGPLLSDFPTLDLSGIDWVIVGGESGPGSRPMPEQWVESIHQHCKTSRTPFFFKQWGGVRKKQAGRTFKGRTWDEMPDGMPRAINKDSSPSFAI